MLYEVITIKEGYNNVTATLEMTVNKRAAPTITFPNRISSIIYGQKLSESILENGSKEYGTFAWTNGNIIPTITNSGYEVTFTPNANTLKNYETITNTTKTVSVSVTKATPTVSVSAKVSGGEGHRIATLTATVTGIV